MTWTTTTLDRLHREYYRLDLVGGGLRGEEFNRLRARMFRLMDACEYLAARRHR